MSRACSTALLPRPVAALRLAPHHRRCVHVDSAGSRSRPALGGGDTGPVCCHWPPPRSASSALHTPRSLHGSPRLARALLLVVRAACLVASAWVSRALPNRTCWLARWPLPPVRPRHAGRPGGRGRAARSCRAHAILWEACEVSKPGGWGLSTGRGLQSPRESRNLSFSRCRSLCPVCQDWHSSLHSQLLCPWGLGLAPAARRTLCPPLSRRHLATSP